MTGPADDVVMSAPLLSVRGLRAWYGRAQILFDVALGLLGRGTVAAQQVGQADVSRCKL